MLPVSSSAGSLISIVRGTTNVTFTTQLSRERNMPCLSRPPAPTRPNMARVGAFSIAGTLSGSGAAAATVKLTGTSSATVTSDPTGHYLISGLANGSYTVTPTKTGMTFTPASQSVTVSGANVTGIDFTSAVTPTFSVSGSISGSGGSSATVTLSGSFQRNCYC